MADRFYTSSSLEPGHLLLQGPEAHHLATVRRFQTGDHVTLFNGDGQEFLARIESIDRNRVEVTISEARRPNRELPFRLELAMPLPKGDRVDFLVEKLTELGVTDLVPLRTARSIVHPRETKLDRLKRTVIEASKQCGRNVLMRVHELTDWARYCANVEQSALRLIAHPGGRNPALSQSIENRTCAVGPEGGFTQEELSAAKEAGWQIVGLGPRVLRMETAAVAMALLAGQFAIADVDAGS